MIRVKAPAKINLSLAIIGKQAHFHEVEMVMTTIDLADYITLSKIPQAKGQIVLEADAPGMALGKGNLVYRAAELFMARYRITDGVTLQIEKNIPIAGGLAGGSSDAAATFKGLRTLFNVDCTDKALCELGAKIGSDIPFCIIGGTALATGRGEIITPIKSPPLCWVIIVNPRMSASTRDIYKAFNFAEADDIHTNLILDAIENENFDDICMHLANHLEPVTAHFFPVIHEIKEALHTHGASGVRMSGSGPTVFALVYTEKKAKQLYRQMKHLFPKYIVHMARLLV
ncbi:MAG: 4-(cytidine 5'-diphospho)-2-C-methyl-D-erythritol kinase [Defluviitaleaceae bacterium]|nr:4-(cytidine 5'-diphospho)-2-C-methyl-D-erythritol kinase [Defluviitaleaceae bacterium]